MRISDWSSDVCSSDLERELVDEEHADPARHDLHPQRRQHRPHRRERHPRIAGAGGERRRGGGGARTRRRHRGAARPRRGCDGDVEEVSGEELSGEELSGEELSGEELSGEGLKGRAREGQRQLAKRGGLPVNAAAMSILGKIFTWWDGATDGTLLNNGRHGRTDRKSTSLNSSHKRAAR